jgi:hypothetical protein
MGILPRPNHSIEIKQSISHAQSRLANKNLAIGLKISVQHIASFISG